MEDGQKFFLLDHDRQLLKTYFKFKSNTPLWAFFMKKNIKVNSYTVLAKVSSNGCGVILAFSSRFEVTYKIS